MNAADLFLGGDSLMGQQVRDNQRALDVLQSLPFVDPEMIGVTGALENVSKLAALPGVDGLFLGPDDLMLRMDYSLSGEVKKRKPEEAIQAVVQACQQFGKDCLCVGAGREMMNICLSAGLGFIVAGGDIGFLAAGSKEALEMFREAVGLSMPLPVTDAAKVGLY